VSAHLPADADRDRGVGEIADRREDVGVDDEVDPGSGVLMLFTHVVVWPLLVLVTVSVLPQGANAVVHGRVVPSANRRKLARPVASVAVGPRGMTMSTTAGPAPDDGPSRKIGGSGV